MSEETDSGPPRIVGYPPTCPSTSPADSANPGHATAVKEWKSDFDSFWTDQKEATNSTFRAISEAFYPGEIVRGNTKHYPLIKDLVEYSHSLMGLLSASDYVRSGNLRPKDLIEDSISARNALNSLKRDVDEKLQCECQGSYIRPYMRKLYRVDKRASCLAARLYVLGTRKDKQLATNNSDLVSQWWDELISGELLTMLGKHSPLFYILKASPYGFLEKHVVDFRSRHVCGSIDCRSNDAR